MQTEHYRVSNIKEAVLSKFFNRVCLDWEKINNFRKGLINLKNLKLLNVIYALVLSTLISMYGMKMCT